jgi:hypothetical protein
MMDHDGPRWTTINDDGTTMMTTNKKRRREPSKRLMDFLLRFHACMVDRHPWFGWMTETRKSEEINGIDPDLFVLTICSGYHHFAHARNISSVFSEE